MLISQIGSRRLGRQLLVKTPNRFIIENPKWGICHISKKYMAPTTTPKNAMHAIQILVVEKAPPYYWNGRDSQDAIVFARAILRKYL